MARNVLMSRDLGLALSEWCDFPVEDVISFEITTHAPFCAPIEICINSIQQYPAIAITGDTFGLMLIPFLSINPDNIRSIKVTGTVGDVVAITMDYLLFDCPPESVIPNGSEIDIVRGIKKKLGDNMPKFGDEHLTRLEKNNG